jgi:hypothetical protein
MSEKTIVQIGENSPEEVAYRLMKDVLALEGKIEHPVRSVGEARMQGVDRAYLLNLYRECIRAVQLRTARES